VQGNALRVLRQLGVWEQVRDAGYTFEGLGLRAPDPAGSLVADLPAMKTGGPDLPDCMGVRRPDLAQILLDRAAAAGVKIRFGTTTTELKQALHTGLSALICSAAYGAAERTAAAWQAHPAGVVLLTPQLRRPGADLEARVERMIRDWQRAVLDLVRMHGQQKRSVARASAYAVNAAGLMVMVAVFAATSFIPTGAEIGVAAGTTIAAQKVLEAVFGDEALRQLTRVARADLMTRVTVLLDAEAARYTALGTALGLSAAPQLDGLSARLSAARRAVRHGIPAALADRRRASPAPGGKAASQ